MGHTKIVEFLLSNGADVDAAASSEVTALWLAASEGRAEVMKILLNKGADAKNTRLDGITALMTASVGGHVDAVKLLLENGADVNKYYDTEMNSLELAQKVGDDKIIKIIQQYIKN